MVKKTFAKEALGLNVKKVCLLLVSLLTLFAVHLHPLYRLQVGGAALPGLYSPEEILKARDIAAATTEELTGSEAAAFPLQSSLRLSLRPGAGDLAALTDALILSSPDVVLADGVFVNGTRLGTVEDGRTLRELLRQDIINQMPNAAVFGNISGQLEIRPVYSRAGKETNYADMILLISGMAPVIYVDSEGRLA